MLGLKQFAEISISSQRLPNPYFQQEKKKSPEIFRASVLLWDVLRAASAVPTIFPSLCVAHELELPRLDCAGSGEKKGKYL